eukprot:CAMPEP_0197188082 /NCGR_PEP_ID=MMETSP1423-20130617/17186_1 /TAXON_ID=476441 /ORGANISM="Pseudo-nitzschia heimii, Strain UNC1101" /LENGTH=188 /DNA_ID=CAMNT_0042639835 /DNA_START=42 /DNA_END=608 /DNA_ORIENTATION=-
MICIGGVCIPYSAVVPFLLMGFKWVFAKLNDCGLLPGFVAEMLKLPKSSSPSPSSEGKKEGSAVVGNDPKACCSGRNDDDDDDTGVVEALGSEERFDDLVKRNEKFVVKFTATWCAPCHKIQPFYERKSAEHANRPFLTVDVDEFDGISGRYNVAMMPTFIVVRGSSVLGTYRGSSKPELETFLNDHL